MTHPNRPAMSGLSNSEEAYRYLKTVFAVCAPQCEPLPDLMGLCTQIDNLIAGYRIKLGELPGRERQP